MVLSLVPSRAILCSGGDRSSEMGNLFIFLLGQLLLSMVRGSTGAWLTLQGWSKLWEGPPDTAQRHRLAEPSSSGLLL